MARDALGAHARDELGISASTAARPVQAALPLLMALVTPISFVVAAVAITSLLFLALLGVVGAKIGGASLLKAAIRVAFWGALAMAVTAAIGALFGTQV
jgi:VIT1/CCC1 family predicted Fe2+/Mn2+ transporter